MLSWKWTQPLLNNFSNQAQKGYLEVQPDAGTPFRRLTFSDIQDLVNASFSLTRAEYLDFMSWYKYDLRQGSLPFQMYDCRCKRNRTARFIGDPPQYQPTSNRYQMSCNIAFEPLVIEEPRILTVLNNLFLLVNDGKKLKVEYGIRL